MSTFGERYQIKGQLGSGGTGAVYEAFDEVIQDSVALKLLAAGEDLLAVREASALRALLAA
jgi:serine/threonine protein kinase